MKLISWEKVLHESPSKTLVLTTHRIRYDWQSGGSGIIKSIMLEQVSSCAMARESYPWLLALAALCFVGGSIGSIQAGVVMFILGLFFAVIFVFAYLASRWQALEIASAGGRIALRVGSWSVEDVRNMIDEIEAAKNARYLLIRSPPVATARP